MESFMKKFVSVLLIDMVHGNSPDPDQVNFLYKIAKRDRHCKADVIISLKSTKVTEVALLNPNSPLYSCLKNLREESFTVVKDVFLRQKIPVDRIWIDNNLLSFTLKRKELIQTTLREVFETGQNYARVRTLDKKKILIVHDTSPEKTSLVHVYRGHVILNHMINMLKFVGAVVQTESCCDKTDVKDESKEIVTDLKESLVIPEEDRLRLYFVCNAKSEHISGDRDSGILKYMHIINTKTGKSWKVPAEDHFKIILTELKQAIELKYGDIESEEGIMILNEQANQCMTLQLLSKTYSDDLKVEVDGDTHNSKDWTFVLYNYARLKSMFEKFEEQVAGGVFAPLPKIEDVDFSLLRHDEEWMLIWEYIIRWPEIVEEFTTAVRENSLKIKSSAATNFMHNLSHCVSVYYSRYHVLASEPLPHLMPLMYARLYLLKAVLLMMDIIFKLLGVNSPPDYM